MLFSILTAVCVVLAFFILMLNVLDTTFFTRTVPTGERAMGLIILFFAALLGGGLMLLATWFCIAGKGLSWIHSSSGMVIAIATLVGVGIAAGGFGAVVGWMELRGPWVVPVGIWCGVIAPIAFGAMLIACVVHPLSSASAAGTARVMAGVLMVVFALSGYAATGRLVLQWAKQASENQARAFEADRVREAEWERRRNRSPIEALREDYAEMSADAPLWVFIASLPDTTDDEVRQFVIARALQVKNFDVALQRTIGNDHPRYRHGCLDLIRFVPDAQLHRNWKPFVSTAITATIQEMASRPTWLTNADPMSNPNPVEHVRSLIAAARRLDPVEGMKIPLGQLSETIESLPDSDAKREALAAFDR